MPHRLRVARKSKSGFTLSELLIVIVILGVLAGIVVFAVDAFSDRGVQGACLADKNKVEVAVKAYKARENHYPTGDDSQQRIGVLVGEDYLRTPPGEKEYKIELASDGTVTADEC